MQFRSNFLAAASTAVALLLFVSAGSVFAGEPIDLFEGEDAADEESSESEANDESSDEAANAAPVIERNASSSGVGRVPGRSNRTFFLEFERRGSAILVEGKVEGRSVYFLFDTGATFTTLTPTLAKKVGAFPDDDAPTMRTRTANGVRTTRLGIVDRLSVGGHLHLGVSYTLCKSCGGSTYRGAPIAGLLGLNVLRRYDVNINSDKGRIEMAPSANFADQSADIEPWVDIEDIDVRYEKTGASNSAQLRFTATNRAPRRIGELRIGVVCPGQSDDWDTSFSLAAGTKDRQEIDMPAETCASPKIRVLSASW